jgi:NADPH2:quinone reductase
MTRDATIHGMTLFNSTEAERASLHAALAPARERHRCGRVIGREFHLADAARAHTAILEPGAQGKIVLVP